MDVTFPIFLRYFCFCGCCTSVAREFSLLPGPGPLILHGPSSHHPSQIRPVFPSGLPLLQWHSPSGKNKHYTNQSHFTILVNLVWTWSPSLALNEIENIYIYYIWHYYGTITSVLWKPKRSLDIPLVMASL